MKTLIGIDVETTSLDPKNGDIIEIAAIRYENGHEIDNFIELARPLEEITPQTTAITGITQEMVAKKPNFAVYKEDLIKFIGKDTVFAHNADFDIGYLTHHGVDIRKNKVIDTFTLASIAWPEADSYNLGTLARELGIQSTTEHRAGEDVRLTWELLQKIQEQLHVSAETLKQINQLLQHAQLKHYQSFFTGREARHSEKSNERIGIHEKSVGSGPTAIEKALGENGPLAKTIPGFIPRAAQIKMATIIQENITEGDISFIEAGTGTGKTFAYTLPLLFSNAKGIISTYTKSLQDQLYQHDIPRLINALALPKTVAILKGRRNYLCHTRLMRALANPPRTQADSTLLIKILVWIEQGGAGDLESLNTSHQKSHLLRHLHADTYTCRHECKAATCPYHIAKRNALEADIVVVNHALLTQKEVDGHLIQSSNLIIDEAQHIEEAARKAAGIDLSSHRAEEVIGPIREITQSDPHIHKELSDLLTDYTKLLEQLTKIHEQHARDITLRLTNQLRQASDWKKIEAAHSRWQGRLQFSFGLLDGIEVAAERRKRKLAALVDDLKQLGQDMSQYIEGNNERIQWLEVWTSGNNKSVTSLHDVPHDVTPLFAKLAATAHSITLTSATLTIGNNMGYIKRQTGYYDAATHQLEEVFDYKENMLLYIANDSPKPIDESYIPYMAIKIQEITSTLSGRTLVLFTSHRSLQDTYYRTVKYFQKVGIKLLAQDMTGGRHNIIRRFHNDPSSVLFGTYSFWEGIDIPGDSLSAVIIPRLPFTPPSDPVTQAIAEYQESMVFEHISLPQMIMRLRQGVGRLIRSETDRGAVIILDSRFLGWSSRNEILQSLPPATTHIGEYTDCIPKIEEWFGEKTLQIWKNALTQK